MGRALRRGKLLRYVTREEAIAAASAQNYPDSNQDPASPSAEKRPVIAHPTGDPSASKNVTSAGGAVGRAQSEREDPGIAGESAFLRLGEKEGVVDCMYCWWMRRDMFELPSLIVINVSFFPLWMPRDQSLKDANETTVFTHHTEPAAVTSAPSVDSTWL
jgi:hypothetical protein